MSISITLEKHIPIPPKAGSGRRVNPDSLYSQILPMEVGDSFEVPAKSVPTVQSAAARIRKVNGTPFKMAVRKQEDGSFRAWRAE